MGTASAGHRKSQEFEEGRTDQLDRVRRDKLALIETTTGLLVRRAFLMCFHSDLDLGLTVLHTSPG